jgi:protein-S-isoprenylcysteine O-methyltransferase Ste14
MKGLGTPEHLITTGLFRIIRHPSSLGVISIMIGWYLAWGALYCIYFVAPIIIIGIFVENKFEEKNLENHFGDEYRLYKKKVGMYFPLIRKNK